MPSAGREIRLGVRAALVDGRLVPGDVVVADGHIAALGAVPAAHSGIAVPGFIDMQVNGFAGVDFAAADPGGYESVAAPLAATGVTAYQPTLITMPEERTVAALGALAAAGRPAGPRIIGMHLEGPFLSAARMGAHDGQSMVLPDAELALRLLAAGPVTMVTLAPELPGALDLVSFLAAQGIVVACGHSDATAAEAKAAFARGASVVTHLFNAQRPFGHREPGIAGAGLDSDAIVSIIVDGFHLAPETVRIVMGAAAGRVALVTDAISAAGMPDGVYPLGDVPVTVVHGEARLRDGTLAGSVLTMDRAVRNLVDHGVSFEDAVVAASAVPARAVRRHDLGSLRPGSVADVVVLDDGLHVLRTMVGGEMVHAAA